MKPRRVARLVKPLAQAIRAGHPWIYDRALPRLPAVTPGEVVVVADDSGPLACAFADPGSPIRARVLDHDPDAKIDGAWVNGRVRAAAAIRRGDPMLAESTGIRLIHGENDFCPGLVVDLYDGVAVVVLDGAGAAAFWRPRLDALWPAIADAGYAITGVWLRAIRGSHEPGPRSAGEALRGDIPDVVEIAENGARFAVDVRRGQKTGFFLDQRQNRVLVRHHAAGAEILNLFCYTGGFSVHAALGGARHVTSVDLAAPAVAGAEDNFRRSGVAPGEHAFVVADAFEYLERAAAEGRRWDLVVVDPPSFAPSERTRPRALAAYERLAVQALAVTGAGGLVAFASCSSHVAEADLLAVLASAGAGARRRLRVRHVLGAASDHPILPAFPEGRYLKFVLADVQ